MYEYKAKITEVHDGDTITCNIDVGFSFTLMNQKIRFSGINAPELSTDEGKQVASILKEKLTGKDVIIHTEKDKKEKYGRWLGTIILDEVNINEWMLTNGYAKVYK
jgi:micrococcal nuclease